MSNNVDYEKMLVRIYVKGSKSDLEDDWARKSALKVNHWLCVFSKKFSKLYQKKVWSKRFWDKISAFLMIFAKGYDFKTKRKVVYNALYLIKPLTETGDKATHYIDDMIYVKDFGE